MTTVLLDDVECKITITADGVHLTDGSSEYFKSSLLIAPQSLLPLIDCKDTILNFTGTGHIALSTKSNPDAIIVTLAKTTNDSKIESKAMIPIDGPIKPFQRSIYGTTSKSILSFITISAGLVEIEYQLPVARSETKYIIYSAKNMVKAQLNFINDAIQCKQNTKIDIRKCSDYYILTLSIVTSSTTLSCSYELTKN